MNSFCINLNLDIPPLRPNVDIYNFPKVYWNTIPMDAVNPKLIDYLYLKGVTIFKVALFFAEGPDFGDIHLDGDKISDQVKLSWTYGDDHLMHWYTTDVIRTYSVANSNRYFIKYEPNEVSTIHSQKVGCPSLIQVGIPHNVTTYSGVRRNITMLLTTNTKVSLPMSQALTLFNDITG
jgi:hypothetical protein